MFTLNIYGPGSVSAMILSLMTPIKRILVIFENRIQLVGAIGRKSYRAIMALLFGLILAVVAFRLTW